MVELTAEEQRVLGCLIEKGATTPDQYPLTMNALLLACNQTTNRDPVVLYDQETVGTALASLRDKQLIRVVYPAHARATKYRHVLGEVWALTEEELAVLAVLMLRGAQTTGELKLRTDRYARFEDLGGVDGVLLRLESRPEPMVARVERQPGQREERFAHLLGDAAKPVAPPAPAPVLAPPPAPATASTELEALEPEVTALSAEVTALGADVTALRAEVTALRADVTALRAEVTALRAEVTALRADVDALKDSVDHLLGQ